MMFFMSSPFPRCVWRSLPGVQAKFRQARSQPLRDESRRKLLPGKLRSRPSCAAYSRTDHGIGWPLLRRGAHSRSARTDHSSSPPSLVTSSCTSRRSGQYAGVPHQIADRISSAPGFDGGSPTWQVRAAPWTGRSSRAPGWSDECFGQSMATLHQRKPPPTPLTGWPRRSCGPCQRYK